MDRNTCVCGTEVIAPHRGVPSVSWSINGKNFIASDTEFFKFIRNWKQRVLVDKLFKKSVFWKCKLPSLPLHGGSWNIWWEVPSVSYLLTLVTDNWPMKYTTQISFTQREPKCTSVHSCQIRYNWPGDIDTQLISSRITKFTFTVSASEGLDHKKRRVWAQTHSDGFANKWLKEYVSTVNRRCWWSTSQQRDVKTSAVVWIVKATSPMNTTFSRCPESTLQRAYICPFRWAGNIARNSGSSSGKTRFSSFIRLKNFMYKSSWFLANMQRVLRHHAFLLFTVSASFWARRMFHMQILRFRSETSGPDWLSDSVFALEVTWYRLNSLSTEIVFIILLSLVKKRRLKIVATVFPNNFCPYLYKTITWFCLSVLFKLLSDFFCWHQYFFRCGTLKACSKTLLRIQKYSLRVIKNETYAKKLF